VVAEAGDWEAFQDSHALCLLIIIGAVMWVVLHRSVYGRYLFAVGRNEEASRYPGSILAGL